MHTMVVRMSIDPERADEAARQLREDVVAWARQQPGFVNGQWLRSPDGSEGIAWSCSPRPTPRPAPPGARVATPATTAGPGTSRTSPSTSSSHRPSPASRLPTLEQAVHELADGNDYVEPVAVGEPVAVPVMQVVGGVIAVEMHHDRCAAVPERSGAQPDRVDRAESGVGDQDDDIGGDEVTQRHRVAVGCQRRADAARRLD